MQGAVGPDHRAPRAGGSTRRWLPPLGLMAHFARSAALEASAHGEQPLTVWIGRRIWPAPHVLVRARQAEPMSKRARQASIDLLRTGSAPLGRDDACVLDHAMLVDAPDAAQRLWAIDLALRSPVVTAVIADGSALDIAATRRLQLAAKSRGRALDAADRAGDALGAGPLALLVRPARECKAPSVATTRWCVTATPTSSGRPCWRVDLLRCRGPGGMGIPSLPGTAAPSSRASTAHGRQLHRDIASSFAPAVLASFFLEWDHALGPVPASPGVVDRPRSAPEPVAAGRPLGRIGRTGQIGRIMDRRHGLDERDEGARSDGAGRVGRTA